MNTVLWNQGNLSIRIATIEDAEQLLAIYAPYVENTAITFEYEVPSLEEFTNRIQNVLKKFPYLVAMENDKIVGYAYASPFKARAAYDWAVETSIYVDGNQKRKGIGKYLYAVLEDLLSKQGILNVNACIAYPVEEDKYLTLDSVKFHEKLGYETVGRFHQCGFKNHKWYDMIWMEKMLGEHVTNQEKVKPISEIIY